MGNDRFRYIKQKVKPLFTNTGRLSTGSKPVELCVGKENDVSSDVESDV